MVRPLALLACLLAPGAAAAAEAPAVVYVKVNRQYLGDFARSRLGDPHNADPDTGLPKRLQDLVKWLGCRLPPWRFAPWDAAVGKDGTVLEIVLTHEGGTGARPDYRAKLKAQLRLHRAGNPQPEQGPELILYPQGEFYNDLTSYKQGDLFARVFGEVRFRDQFDAKASDHRALFKGVPVCFEVTKYLPNSIQAVLPLDYNPLRAWLRSRFLFRLTADRLPRARIEGTACEEDYDGSLRVNCVCVEVNNKKVAAARFQDLPAYRKGEVYIVQFIDTVVSDQNTLVAGQRGDPCD
jgi:hypothetical protein